jgi:hypothetical protein
VTLPGHDEAGRDREDDRERVQGDGAARDERLQDVALELLHGDHDTEDHESGCQPCAHSFACCRDPLDGNSFRARVRNTRMWLNITARRMV